MPLAEGSGEEGPMADPRHVTLAQVLLGYSLRIRPGDKLLVQAPPRAAPLIREVYREALRLGAFPDVQLALDGLEEIRLREGSDEQLRHLSPLRLHEVEYFDAILRVRAAENTQDLGGIDPQRQVLAQRADGPRAKRFAERAAQGALRWCGTLFPTPAHAQDAGMSLADYEDFVFGAQLLDRDDPAAVWRQVHAEQARIMAYLSQHDELRVVAPDTDLTCRVGGRTWINSSGARNFPSGEVFTGPHEDSASGTIRFSFPAVYLGRGRGRAADVRAGPGGGGDGAARGGVPPRHARPRPGRALPGRGRLRAQLRHHPLHAQHPLRREDRRHDAPGARPVLPGQRRDERVGVALGPDLRPGRGPGLRRR